MIYHVLLLAIALGSSNAADPPAGQANTVAIPAPGSADEIERTYDDLLARPETERVRALLALPSSVQAAIWRHRFLLALARHPEYTADQRSVLQEGLSILTPDLFALDRSTLQWVLLVDQPLRRLKQRAIVAFGPSAAKELFTRLTPETNSEAPDFGAAANSARDRNTRSVPRPKAIAGMAGGTVIPVATCQCSMEDDWCDTFGSGLGIYVCRGVPCWPTQGGCGFFLRANCNGLCGYREPT